MAAEHASVSPPAAKKVPRTFVNHGDKRVDDYYWLRDRTNPDVIAYLEAENKYTDSVMKPTEVLQKKLFDELVARVKQDDASVPEPEDGWLYYARTENGKSYPLYCRKRGEAGTEEVFLDPNQLADGRKYFKIGLITVSPNHAMVAYSSDTTGAEAYTVRIKDLKTGKLLPDELTNVGYSVEWANDDKTLYYVTLDATRREFELRRHTLGADPKQDAVLYQENDPTYRIGLSKTRSKAYLLLESNSTMATEVRFKSADGPDGDFQMIEPRKRDVRYDVEHHGEDFYLRVADEQTKNYSLMKTAVATPGRAHWKEVIPHRRDAVVERVDAFEKHLVVTVRENALRKLRITDIASGASHDVDFPETAYSVSVGRNPEFKTATLRFTYSSLVTPASVFDYDMAAKTRVLKKRTEVLGGFDPANYVSERIYAKAADGVEIPISLVYRKGMALDGKNPALLYGYGSYGITTDAGFSADRFSLIDRGFVYAIAHIRGSGDVSRYWYEDGKLFKKANTFSDFVACADHLIAKKYTSAAKLSALGGSAGGLLMGAVINLKPENFRAVIAKVPFVDVINTMLDATIPLTTEEWDEWGNPDKPDYYKYMKSYSPYDNVAKKKYPNLMITTGLNDPRVAYWEPAKWTAKLRAMKSDKNVLILKTDMGAGHGGASGRYDKWKEVAFDYAFLLRMLGVE